MLLICVEAGMSIEMGFNKVSQEIGSASPELAEEFGITVAELSYLPDRRQAYENLAIRTGHEGVKAVCMALGQAERYGTPLGDALRLMAKENREMRMSEAEKKAAALPAQLTVPMILFFLPVLFLVVLGPAYIKYEKMQGDNDVARCAGAAPRRTGAPARRGTARAKADLGRLVTLEAGKIPEGLGEVQEMIDICDFAVGSRASSRPDHRLRTPRPPHDGNLASGGRHRPSSRRSTSRSRSGRGTPRWRWSAATAVIWKPSEKTPLTALAVMAVFERAMQRQFGRRRAGRAFGCLIGGPELGAILAAIRRLPWSRPPARRAMGRAVAPVVAQRFGVPSLNSAATMPPSSVPRRILI
jgi:hypothetical protein